MFDWMVPVVLGFSAVLQAAINRTLAAQSSLANVVLLNSVVVLVYAVVLNILLNERIWPHSPGQWSVPWPVLLSALFGFVLVMGFPYSIGKVGAVATSILFVLANLFASVAWDIFVEHIPMTPMRWSALLLASASAVLFSLSK